MKTEQKFVWKTYISHNLFISAVCKLRCEFHFSVALSCSRDHSLSFLLQLISCLSQLFLWFQGVEGRPVKMNMQVFLPHPKIGPKRVLTCIQKVSISVFNQVTGYPHRHLKFSSVPPGKHSSGNTSIRPWLLPPNLFQFTSHPIIHAIQSQLQRHQLYIQYYPWCNWVTQ